MRVLFPVCVWNVVLVCVLNEGSHSQSGMRFPVCVLNEGPIPSLHVEWGYPNSLPFPVYAWNEGTIPSLCMECGSQCVCWMRVPFPVCMCNEGTIIVYHSQSVCGMRVPFAVCMWNESPIPSLCVEWDWYQKPQCVHMHHAVMCWTASCRRRSLPRSYHPPPTPWSCWATSPTPQAAGTISRSPIRGESRWSIDSIPFFLFPFSDETGNLLFLVVYVRPRTWLFVL